MANPRLLGEVPASLEGELFDKYREIERNFRERRWEPSELNGGKLCEVAYTILRGHIDGTFPLTATKPGNFFDACQKLEQAPKSFSRSHRILIPRILIALYEIRNNRGVGHVGGDVNPNHMDSVCVLHMAKWVVAELIRIFHVTTTDQAAKIVDSLSDREMPIIWDTGEVKRVLDTKLTMLQKTLALLYSSMGTVNESDILASVEHSNPSAFRRDVLRKAHKNRLLEYDESAKTLQISPSGIQKFEDEVLRIPLQ